MEFNASVYFIHKESVTMHGHMILKLAGVYGSHDVFISEPKSVTDTVSNLG